MRDGPKKNTEKCNSLQGIFSTISRPNGVHFVVARYNKGRYVLYAGVRTPRKKGDERKLRVNLHNGRAIRTEYGLNWGSLHAGKIKRKGWRALFTEFSLFAVGYSKSCQRLWRHQSGGWKTCLAVEQKRFEECNMEQTVF